MCMAMSPTHHKHNMFVNDNEYIASGNKFINKLNVPVSIYLLLYYSCFELTNEIAQRQVTDFSY